MLGVLEKETDDWPQENIRWYNHHIIQSGKAKPINKVFYTVVVHKLHFPFHEWMRNMFSLIWTNFELYLLIWSRYYIPCNFKWKTHRDRTVYLNRSEILLELLQITITQIGVALWIFLQSGVEKLLGWRGIIGTHNPRSKWPLSHVKPFWRCYLTFVNSWLDHLISLDACNFLHSI